MSDQQLGEQFVTALCQQDRGALAALLTDDARMRALIPSRLREEDGAPAVVGRFVAWFGDASRIDVKEMDVTGVGEKLAIRYRFVVTEDGADHDVEQTIYATTRDGRLATLDLLCTGFHLRAP
jgi:hypothetical protein